MVFEDGNDIKDMWFHIIKLKATFFSPGMRKEKPEYLMTTEMIGGKRSRGKQHEKMLDGLTKWLKVGRVREALKQGIEINGRS